MSELPRNVFTTCPKEESSRAVVPKDEFKIYAFEGLSLKLIMIVKSGITMNDIDKSAKCVALVNYYVTRLGDDKKLTKDMLPIKSDIVLHKKDVVLSEYKIFDYVTGRELMIVKNAITYEDALKAAKCAKVPPLEAYFTKSTAAGSEVKLTSVDFPIRHNIVVSRKVTAKRKPEVFHVCESTSTPPVRKPVKKVAPAKSVDKVSAKRKLIKVAIKGLQAAIDSLNELEKII